MVDKKKSKQKVQTGDLNAKLDKILKNQELILDNERKILGEEEEIKELERQEIEKENLELTQNENTLQSLEELQKSIQESSRKTVRKITKRDFLKGFIGAFIGVMSHFAFTKAVSIAEHLTVIRATYLYIVALLIIIAMLYYTGFRNIQKQTVLKFLPMRATILYFVSIFTIIFVNLLFAQIESFAFWDVYKLVGANIILAVIGAGTADLIGKMEED